MVCVFHLIQLLYLETDTLIECYELWEQLLLAEDPLRGDYLLISFCAVAFLCQNRISFLHCDPSDLPVLLTSKLSYHRRRTKPAHVKESPTKLVFVSDALR
jgi:hypothetical protein